MDTTCDVCGKAEAMDADYDCECDPECESCRSKCWTDHSDSERITKLTTERERLRHQIVATLAAVDVALDEAERNATSDFAFVKHRAPAMRDLRNALRALEAGR